jgi:predicted Zn-dependent protease
LKPLEAPRRQQLCAGRATASPLPPAGEGQGEGSRAQRPTLASADLSSPPSPRPSPASGRGGKWARLAFLSLLGAVLATPASAQFNILSTEEAKRLGKEAHLEAVKEHGGIYEDPNIGGYIATVGGRLVLASDTPKAEFSFSVLDSPILNAFATPGYVHITRGLLAIFNSEDEMASVLGHEIGHVTAQHVEETQSIATVGGIGLSVLGAVLGNPNLDQLIGLGANLGLAKYSRSNENEADSIGLRTIARAGYNPRASAMAMESLEASTNLQAKLKGAHAPSVIDSFFSTHPNSPDRVRNLLEQARASGLPLDKPLNREGYLRAIDGMIWGDSSQQGMVRGREFIHPELRIAVTFPEGFSISNKQQAVIATSKSGAAIRLDMAAPKQQADPLGYITNEWGAKLRVGNAERITVNGMAAATAAARVQSEKGTVDLRLVAVQHEPQRMFRLLFQTPTNQTAQLADALQRMTYSFRRIDAKQVGTVKPLRVRVVQVKAGDTPQIMASRMRVPQAPLEYFMTMNGLKSGEPLRPGELVKIVSE